MLLYVVAIICKFIIVSIQWFFCGFFFLRGVFAGCYFVGVLFGKESFYPIACMRLVDLLTYISTVKINQM